MTLFLTRYIFFLFLEIEDNKYIDIGMSLSPLILGVMLWLFGPTAILVYYTVSLMSIYRNFATIPEFNGLVIISAIRLICITTAAEVFFVLVTLEAYTSLGGIFPLADLSAESVLRMVFASFLIGISSLLSWSPFIWLAIYSPYARENSSAQQQKGLRRQFLLAYGNNFIMFLFSILGAGIYQFINDLFFVFFGVGVMAVAYLGYSMSRAVELNRQRSLELVKLEKLGQTLLNAPPDAATLDHILEEHVRNMFFQSNIEIHQFPDTILLPSIKNKIQKPYQIDDESWQWAKAQTEMAIFAANTKLPWGKTTKYNQVFVPIRDEIDERVWGGIWLATLARNIDSLLPSLQTVASQIGATLRSAEIYAENLLSEKNKQELAIAGEIQHSFLPDILPQIEGWQLAVSLEPARQTSGDFYDFIPLENGNLGIVVADVADKGTGAALFMALSRTLIRTYALQYPTEPHRALAEANKRILEDTHNNLFVTVFYGVLNPHKNELIYANAGHNPGYLWQRAELHELKRTGIPLGMMEDRTWRIETIDLADDAVLVLYTDGVTEAQNAQAELFEEAPLKNFIQQTAQQTAQAIQQGILHTVHEFVGDAPQVDDITLLVLKRSSNKY